MRAINAMVAPSNAAVWNLAERSSWSKMDRSFIKRADRRKQRHALRAELPSVVLSNLEADRLALEDNRRETGDFDDWYYSDLMKEFGVAADPSPRTVEETILMLPAPTRPRQVQTVTVIRKRAHQRRVVEQLRVAA